MEYPAKPEVITEKPSTYIPGILKAGKKYIMSREERIGNSSRSIKEA
jgi:hypothetical protein